MLETIYITGCIASILMIYYSNCKISYTKIYGEPVDIFTAMIASTLSWIMFFITATMFIIVKLKPLAYFEWYKGKKKGKC